jgi:23S rRNA (uridine2552-2'-O)-methyltransferase
MLAAALSQRGVAPAGRRTMSHLWKAQRDSDKYADMAIAEGLRSRAAYKLSEIDNRFDRFLRQGACVVDLGAAPGGFSVVAARRIHLDAAIDRWDKPQRTLDGSNVQHDSQAGGNVRRAISGHQRRRKYGKLVCVDIQDMDPIRGAQFVKGDFMDSNTQSVVQRALGGDEADVVLSDMSPSTTGERELNHDRIVDLAEEAAAAAKRFLRNGGIFVCKLFNGASEREFRDSLRADFLHVKAVKPAASRRSSPEIFYVATGFVPQCLQIRQNNKLETIEVDTGILGCPKPVTLSDVGSVDDVIADLKLLNRTRQ